ncbi:hypothetical protein K1719_044427 [Acacia pycnantha]|nr:hypothetical protein K1719_044427 [Acacia pycnantha]
MAGLRNLSVQLPLGPISAAWHNYQLPICLFPSKTWCLGPKRVEERREHESIEPIKTHPSSDPSIPQVREVSLISSNGRRGRSSCSPASFGMRSDYKSPHVSTPDSVAKKLLQGSPSNDSPGVAFKELCFISKRHICLLKSFVRNLA